MGSCTCVLKKTKMIWLCSWYLALIIGSHFIYKTAQEIRGNSNFGGGNQEKMLFGNMSNASDLAVIDMLRERYLLPPSVYDYNLSTDPDYKERSVMYGWEFVHGVLTSLFDKEYSKFFVEAGGLDGEFLSNTLWLERDRHWTGLIVEPEPRNFREMVLKRRKCWIANVCLSKESFPNTIDMVATERLENQTHLDPETIRGGTHEIGSHLNTEMYSWFEKDLRLKKFSSQCFPLYSLLLALNQTVIDFLSLDIQGTEIRVFDTIPLDIFYIRTLVIEHEKSKFDKEFVLKMNEKGFNILALGGAPDYFFVNQKETHLIDRYQRSNRYIQEYVDEGYAIHLTGRN